jgi:hypothetical protein
VADALAVALCHYYLKEKPAAAQMGTERKQT